MTERTLAIDGVEVPRFLYGTAWKEDQTQHLVELALERGFRGLDTANQRRHYDEAAVGRSIAAINFSSVDLPAPEWPAIVTSSPGATVKLTLLSASMPGG